MCGLIYCKHLQSNKSVKNIVKKRFEKQRTRGTQGFGFVEIKEGIVTSEIRTQTEKEALEHLKNSTASEILFHHRIPTSTPNFIESTHPIKVSHESLKYNYYVIHNGIISNDYELYEEHEKLGFNYHTKITKQWVTSGNTYSETMFNDSESLAIDFCLSLENNVPMKAKGSIAMIVLQYEKETGKTISLFYCRNHGNPLKVEKSKDFLAISSETGKEIEANTLYKLDYETLVISKEAKAIGVYNEPKSSYTYPYSYQKSLAGFDTKDKEDSKWVDEYNYNNSYEESEFESIDYADEIKYIKAEMKKAELQGDYELFMELETELEEMQINQDADLKYTLKNY